MATSGLVNALRGSRHLHKLVKHREISLSSSKYLCMQIDLKIPTRSVHYQNNCVLRSPVNLPVISDGSRVTSVSSRCSKGHLRRCVWAWNQQAKRYKYRGQNSDEEESDEDDDDSDDEFGKHFEEDETFPNNYRELKKYVSSLRADSILGGGLNISRKKIDDYFLESKLRLNGERILKKSKQLREGDCVDLVMEEDDETLKVKRVRVVSVSDKRSTKDRLLVFLRAWRGGVVIPRPEGPRSWTPR